jgi:hypothetical protein
MHLGARCGYGTFGQARKIVGIGAVEAGNPLRRLSPRFKVRIEPLRLRWFISSSRSGIRFFHPGANPVGAVDLGYGFL